MPKQRITKETVVDAAFELAREGGMEQVLVKNIADRIGCSVQPIYSYCKNMEGLRKDVAKRTRQFIQAYTAVRVDADDLFRSTGNAYMQLAGEEPHLFRIFILHQREGIASLEDLYRAEADPQVAGFIADKLGISMRQARRLHLNMLIYTIGLGTIFSVTMPGIPTDEIAAQQEAACEAFVKQIMREGEVPDNSDTIPGTLN